MLNAKTNEEMMKDFFEDMDGVLKDTIDECDCFKGLMDMEPRQFRILQKCMRLYENYKGISISMAEQMDKDHDTLTRLNSNVEALLKYYSRIDDKLDIIINKIERMGA